LLLDGGLLIGTGIVVISIFIIIIIIIIIIVTKPSSSSTKQQTNSTNIPQRLIVRATLLACARRRGRRLCRCAIPHSRYLGLQPLPHCIALGTQCADLGAMVGCDRVCG
jgi:hypothetical protein